MSNESITKKDMADLRILPIDFSPTVNEFIVGKSSFFMSNQGNPARPTLRTHSIAYCRLQVAAKGW
jgi:hypothetical protein